MEQQLKAKILEIMDGHRIMTVATVRPDGFPQATTVGFVHDGLSLYFICGADSQKAHNIERNDKVSVTIDTDHEDFLHIKGLSLGGIASRVTDEREIDRVYELLVERYPDMTSMPKPAPEAVKVFRVEPQVISVLDYSKGFGHTDLVHVDAEDVHPRDSKKHWWSFLPYQAA